MITSFVIPLIFSYIGFNYAKRICTSCTLSKNGSFSYKSFLKINFNSKNSKRKIIQPILLRTIDLNSIELYQENKETEQITSSDKKILQTNTYSSILNEFVPAEISSTNSSINITGSYFDYQEQTMFTVCLILVSIFSGLILLSYSIYRLINLCRNKCQPDINENLIDNDHSDLAGTEL